MAFSTHPPLRAEVNERVELYLYSLLGLVACSRVNLMMMMMMMMMIIIIIIMQNEQGTHMLVVFAISGI